MATPCPTSSHRLMDFPCYRIVSESTTETVGEGSGSLQVCVVNICNTIVQHSTMQYYIILYYIILYIYIVIIIIITRWVT